MKLRYLRTASITAMAFAMTVTPYAPAFAQIKKMGLGPILKYGKGVPAKGVAGDNNFSSIAEDITISLEELPALLSGLSYLLAMLLGVQGVLKIKDHVENPQQFPIKVGAVRLLAGGALFALPIVYEAMFQTVGTTTASISAAPMTSLAAASPGALGGGGGGGSSVSAF